MLDPLHLHAVIRVALDVQLAARRDAEGGALEADEVVGEAAVLREDRRAVSRVRARLDHPRSRPLHELTGVGDGVVVVLVDDRVAVLLEAGAADHDELALDRGGTHARRRGDDDRCRRHGH